MSRAFPHEPGGDLDGAAAFVTAAGPDLPRGGSASAFEGDHWLVTASAYLGVTIPRVPATASVSWRSSRTWSGRRAAP